MRKGVMRTFIATLSLGVVCASGAAVSALNVTAENSGNTFEMMDKISIGVFPEADTHGIKFYANVGTPVENADYYMMIVPQKYVDALGLEAGDDYYTEIKTAMENVLGEEKTAETLAVMECLPFADETLGDSYYIQGSLASIQYNNLNEDWFAIAYYNDGTQNVYAGGGEGVSQDVVYVASKLYSENPTSAYSDIYAKYVYGGINQSLGVTDNPDTEEDERYAEISGTFTFSEELVMLTEAGQTKTLSVQGVPNVDFYQEWSSSNEAVATVKDGVVTAVGDGATTITCKALNQVLTCEVTMNEDFSQGKYLEYWNSVGKVVSANGGKNIRIHESADPNAAPVGNKSAVLSSDLIEKAVEAGYRYLKIEYVKNGSGNCGYFAIYNGDGTLMKGTSTTKQGIIYLDLSQALCKNGTYSIYFHRSAKQTFGGTTKFDEPYVDIWDATFTMTNS